MFINEHTSGTGVWWKNAHKAKAGVIGSEGKDVSTKSEGGLFGQSWGT